MGSDLAHDSIGDGHNRDFGDCGDPAGLLAGDDPLAWSFFLGNTGGITAGLATDSARVLPAGVAGSPWLCGGDFGNDFWYQIALFVCWDPDWLDSF